jgi:hypothetical protein
LNLKKSLGKKESYWNFDYLGKQFNVILFSVLFRKLHDRAKDFAVDSKWISMFNWSHKFILWLNWQPHRADCWMENAMHCVYISYRIHLMLVGEMGSWESDFVLYILIATCFRSQCAVLHRITPYFFFISLSYAILRIHGTKAYWWFPQSIINTCI